MRNDIVRVRGLPNINGNGQKQNQRLHQRYLRDPWIGGAKCCVQLAYVCLFLCQSLNIIKTTAPKKRPTLWFVSLFRSPVKFFSSVSVSLSLPPLSIFLLCFAFYFLVLRRLLSHSWRYLCIARRTFNIYYMCIKYKARLFYSRQFWSVYTLLRLYVVTIYTYTLHINARTLITHSYMYSSFWLCTNLIQHTEKWANKYDGPKVGRFTWISSECIR